MHYAEFLDHYKNAHHDWSFGRIRTPEAADRIAHLRTLVPMIEPDAKRRTAEYLLGDFVREISPESQDRMARASEVVAAASSDEGTVAERIARAEQGIADVTAIANETDNSNEQYAILSLNEWLVMNIVTLQHQNPVQGGDNQ